LCEDEVAASGAAKELKQELALAHATGFMEKSAAVLQLCEPVQKAMVAVEADKAYLPGMLPLIKSLEEHAREFSSSFPHLAQGFDKNGRPIWVEEVFKRRLRRFCCTSLMRAAYLLDPLNFVEMNGEIHPPFDLLECQEINDALEGIERLGGHQAIEDLVKCRLTGFLTADGAAQQALRECSMTLQSAANGGQTIHVPEVSMRRRAWSNLLAKDYPHLAQVAAQYLCMHASSCEAERDLSNWSRLYDKLRGRMNVARAEKMAFLAFNDRVERTGDLREGGIAL
jgi:hypothetical protein